MASANDAHSVSETTIPLTMSLMVLFASDLLIETRDSLIPNQAFCATANSLKKFTFTVRGGLFSSCTNESIKFFSIFVYAFL
jgi:hypothetical protein